jgi:hypothetical protein
MRYTIAARNTSGQNILIHSSYLNDETGKPFSFEEIYEAVDNLTGCKCNPILIGMPSKYTESLQAA